MGGDSLWNVYTRTWVEILVRFLSLVDGSWVAGAQGHSRGPGASRFLCLHHGLPKLGCWEGAPLSGTCRGFPNCLTLCLSVFSWNFSLAGSAESGAGSFGYRRKKKCVQSKPLHALAVSGIMQISRHACRPARTHGGGTKMAGRRKGNGGTRSSLCGRGDRTRAIFLQSGFKSPSSHGLASLQQLLFILLEGRHFEMFLK